ncbi:MAG: YHS domain-containing protein [Flavobacteriales bacterium]|nr:YHS domain-containing protein [Flavobacteriales bacterium]
MSTKRILLLSSPLLLIGLLYILIMATGIKPIFLGMHEPIAAEDGIALSGFDPISYRTEPIKGSKEFSYEWKGVVWYFSSEENLKLFKDAPDKYCPAFGGHCALATSTGFAVHGDPSTYAIVEDTLYIFSGDEVKTTYMNDLSNSIKQSREAWNE